MVTMHVEWLQVAHDDLILLADILDNESITHLKALEALNALQCTHINLGTGTGYSVLDIVKAFKKASQKPIPYIIAPRREGDITSRYADPSNAINTIGWSTYRNLDQMCQGTWNFQSKNPDEYGNATEKLYFNLNFRIK